MTSIISVDRERNENLEIFQLIWLDVDSSKGRNIAEKFRSIVSQLKQFSDVKQCQEYIEQTSDKDRLILIVNGSFGRQIVPIIHNIHQIISIYIYCMNKQFNEEWSSTYSKVCIKKDFQSTKKWFFF